jgi:hypothetical protein
MTRGKFLRKIIFLFEKDFLTSDKQLTMTEDVYQENGYESREAYLRALAEDNGVELEIVKALAELLGPDEDFDGLVSAIEDAQDFEF